MPIVKICCKSLKNTFATETTNAIPNEKLNKRRNEIGKNNREIEISIPINNIIMKRTQNDSKASMKNAIDVLSGKIIFGKYICFIIDSLNIIDDPAESMVVEKKFQGIKPENKNTVNNFKSWLNKLEKIKAITVIISNGVNIVHT